MVRCLVPQQLARRSRKAVWVAIAEHVTAVARLHEIVTYGGVSRAEEDAAHKAEADALRGVAVARHARKASFGKQMRYLTALSQRDPRNIEYLRAIGTAAEFWLLDRERSDDRYEE